MGLGLLPILVGLLFCPLSFSLSLWLSLSFVEFQIIFQRCFSLALTFSTHTLAQRNSVSLSLLPSLCLTLAQFSNRAPSPICKLSLSHTYSSLSQTHAHALTLLQLSRVVVCNEKSNECFLASERKSESRNLAAFPVFKIWLKKAFRIFDRFLFDAWVTPFDAGKNFNWMRPTLHDLPIELAAN